MKNDRKFKSKDELPDYLSKLDDENSTTLNLDEELSKPINFGQFSSLEQWNNDIFG